MRLYLKLYLYFVVVITILFIMMPFIMIPPGKPHRYFPPSGRPPDPSAHHGPPEGMGRPPGGNKPPHMHIFDDITVVNNYLKTIEDKETLQKEISRFAKSHQSAITLYDDKGQPLLWTEKAEPLEGRIIRELQENNIFIDDMFPKGKTWLVVPVTQKEVPYAYLSIVSRHNFFMGAVHRMAITFPIVFILIYPLALHFSKPLEKITQKANRYSTGDFSDLNKAVPLKGSDEIARLDKAFNHMARELVAMIESKKELISDISHELGSPLSRMQVAVDILDTQMKEGKAPSEKTLTILSKNIEEMSKTVKELLDLSRANKTYTLNISQIDVGAMVDTMVQDYQVIMEKNQIHVEVTKEGELDCISADRKKIGRIMQNLLSNAMDYSPEKGVISISLKGEKGHFSFTIKDNGPGIAEENREKIFEPFFREDPSRARKTGGTGLGLAIVKKFVSLHEGQVWVENPGQKGACITFRI